MARGVPEAGRAHRAAGALSGGRGRPSGARGSDLDALGPHGGALDLGGFHFDAPIPPGGYRWRYADAVSEDGRFSLVLIALLGSVFSPFYAWAGRRAPLDHCALNVCLYGPGATRWALTERRSHAVAAGPETLELGPSRIAFEDDALIFDIHEHAAPLPFPIRGRVTIRPDIEQTEVFTLDARARHVWRPVWPSARVEARFDAPEVTFTGHGYVDMNAGITPLETAFTSWSWARTPLDDGAAIIYDSLWRDGGGSGLALRIGKDGVAERFDPPPQARLARTGWRVGRPVRADGDPRVRQTLEDTPFYARSLIETGLLGQRRLSMHESLDLTRFDTNWVKVLLPFRMPRAFWRQAGLLSFEVGPKSKLRSD